MSEHAIARGSRVGQFDLRTALRRCCAPRQRRGLRFDLRTALRWCAPRQRRGLRFDLRTALRRCLRAGFLVALLAGCDAVTGGAVELSWKLRPASSALEDKFVACDSGKEGTGPVTEMQLDWQVGAAAGSVAWPCEDSHGVTGFDLPPGDALLWVRPVCAYGPAEPASYIAPAPEQRRVNVGNTVSLGAVELILTVASCEAQPCICELAGE